MPSPKKKTEAATAVQQGDFVGHARHLGIVFGIVADVWEGLDKTQSASVLWSTGTYQPCKPQRDLVRVDPRPLTREMLVALRKSRDSKKRTLAKVESDLRWTDGVLQGAARAAISKARGGA